LNDLSLLSGEAAQQIAKQLHRSLAAAAPALYVNPEAPAASVLNLIRAGRRPVANSSPA
jgi:hypothetical protein